MDDRFLKAFGVFVVAVLAAGCLGPSPSNEPSSDHSVTVDNQWTQNATIDITIVRNASGEVVHTGTYVLTPPEAHVVYNTDQASLDSVETFIVRWAGRNETGQVEMRTSDCFGDVSITIDEDGDIQAGYTIC